MRRWEKGASYREGFTQGLMDVAGPCPSYMDGDAYADGVKDGNAHRDTLREEHDVRRTTDELANR